MKQIEYGFWFWSRKLDGILRMLSSITGYHIDEIEYQIIKEELRMAFTKKDHWISYDLSKDDNLLKTQLLIDAEVNDIIHIRIVTVEESIGIIESINLFQALFRDLEFED